jgi:hypothetical protein
LTSCERFVAVDWSGRARGAAGFIWVAEVVGGRLVALTAGRGREATVAYLKGLVAAGDERVVVGLDFAFSAPAWWLDAVGVEDGPELWAWMAAGNGEAVLRAEPTPAPFWGRAGSRRAVALAGREELRATERGTGARSVFQIGGAGAVGTGSLRGMALLPTLAEAYAIWPWEVGPHVALEIYPRLLTGPVVKSSASARVAYLRRDHGDQAPALLAHAATSEDAFDAAVSALAMAAAADELRALSADPQKRREGAIWIPG